MSSRKKGKEGKKNKSAEQVTYNEKWIPFRTGVSLIAIVSICLAIFTAWQRIPAIGWLQGSLYALMYGVMIWVVFFVIRLFYKFTQR